MKRNRLKITMESRIHGDVYVRFGGERLETYRPKGRQGALRLACDPIKRMPRTPDYYGYFTFTSAPLKNFDFSLSGVYTGKMVVPHFAGYIEKDRLEHTPNFMELNLKLNYTFVLNDHLKLQLNGGVQNMFNAFQKDLDRGALRDSKYFYGPTQPRTYFIGVKFFN